MGSCKSAVSCEAGQRVLARVIPLRRYMEDDQKLQQDRGSAHLGLGRLPLCGTERKSRWKRGNGRCLQKTVSSRGRQWH